MMRIAAVGDVHLAEDARGLLRPALDKLHEHADVLLLAGDLTRHGTVEEASVVADEFRNLGVPVIAVLGNHDHHCDAADEITALLESRDITVLEGTTATVAVDGQTLGVAGIKGFGGGFAGKCASAFGERQMKDFAGHTVEVAAELRRALSTLETDIRVALTHYSPISDTLHGEPPEIYPFLGSYLLGEPIDEFGVDLAVHGHAHAGRERGTTPGGVRVRNVAQPVIHSAYAVYGIHTE
ncbi:MULTISPECIES: metallophosphoesterase [Rhodococcus]|uniref:Metallophosphoesterase n=1 Tax=Rhodococcus oxybenzonivorans TaxID=1990687 RepID=A0AAE4V591_9NOCA|nr:MULTISPECIES: metallophosphoesterase [Rhodococcus]MDV7242361.1 metallophosphoesterase [Rhodococcus oxybenzonivorans]MDV7268858.1 metallophosphoesterase [Rhodococcus oxybenzonivorans]MDV7277108.1 metallophosphoesterase [Rhodococcus oxybenzonivorans]MDV7331850.1 metallophosphoesterase [Rhodococcus oxybenzonivorans]MDV7344071.1 metallophosphoesterase [Rhodococcus oxybenzonivorans]